MGINLKPVVRQLIAASAMEEMRSLAVRASFNNFVSLYSAPGDATTSDLVNRLGIVTAVDPLFKTISAADFPPFKASVSESGLPSRSLGFKSINEQINYLQNIWRVLTGQIRTKITEWDLSLYLQEQLYDEDKDIYRFSLLFRLIADNKLKLTGNQALALSNLTTALSHKKFQKWNPTADPDLKEWAPPTTEAELFTILNPPPPTIRRFLWYSFVTPPPSLDTRLASLPADVAADIRAMLECDWGSWYPEYWRLFYKSPEATLSPEEQQDQADALQNVDVTGAADSDALKSLGIRTQSPLFFGRPYGRNMAAESIGGYLQNKNVDIPKIAPDATNTYNAINKYYTYAPSLSGVTTALAGWTTRYTTIGYQTEQQDVWDEDLGRTVREDVQIPYDIINTATGMWPNAAGTLVEETAQKNPWWRPLLWFLFPLGTLGAALWKPKKKARINGLTNAAGFDCSGAKGDGGITALFTSPSGIAFIAPVKEESETYWTWERRRIWFFGWRNIRVPVLKTTYYTLVDLTGISMYYVDSSEESFTPVTVKIDKLLPMTIKGVYYNIPARTLGANDNILTAGWDPSVPTWARSLITKMFMNGIWQKSDGTAVRVPIKAAVKELNAKMIGPIVNVTSTLIDATTNAGNNPSGFASLIDSLPAAVRAQANIVAARTFFTTRSNALLTAVQALKDMNILPLRSAINGILGAGTSGYTYGNLTTLMNSYAPVLSAVNNPILTEALNHWLNVLYAYRLEILKRRLNKSNGTLFNAAQAIQSHMLLANTPATDIPGMEYVAEDLKVVHRVTTVSLANRLAGATRANEKVKIVYTPVKYSDTGAIMRPTAGNYQLISQEILDTDDAPISFYITFKGAKAPRIIKNVMTSVDAAKLTSLMANPNLSKLEMICAARKVEDWWEIIIPVRLQPIATKYVNDMHLVLAVSDADADALTGIAGSRNSMPIWDDVSRTFGGVS